MSFLICSSERAVRKQAGDTANGILPAAASPAETPTKFCSAIPTSTICFGSSLANGTSLPEPRESLVTTTTLRFLRASDRTVSANVIQIRLAFVQLQLFQQR